MGDDIQRLAQKLGGGWKIESGLIPVVTLTVMEARGVVNHIEFLEERIQELKDEVLELEKYGPTED